MPNEELGVAVAMFRKTLGAATLVALTSAASAADQRWLAPNERLESDGEVVEHPLPNPNSGPTTIARISARRRRARRRAHGRQRSPAANAARESALVRRRRGQQAELPRFPLSITGSSLAFAGPFG
jgi:hypothetical protein